MTLAKKAVSEFSRTETIPNLGQRIQEGFGPGTVHVFPDGSIACHWQDGSFLEAEVSPAAPKPKSPPLPKAPKRSATGASRLYIVEVRGSNAASSQIGPWDHGIRAVTSGAAGWVAAAHPDRRIALYPSRASAERAVSLGELFPGQSHRIRQAKQNEIAGGLLAPSLPNQRTPKAPKRSAKVARVGATVTAGSGTDRDTGTIMSIAPNGLVEVAWSHGDRTIQPAAALGLLPAKAPKRSANLTVPELLRELTEAVAEHYGSERGGGAARAAKASSDKAGRIMDRLGRLNASESAIDLAYREGVARGRKIIDARDAKKAAQAEKKQARASKGPRPESGYAYKGSDEVSGANWRRVSDEEWEIVMITPERAGKIEHLGARTIDHERVNVWRMHDPGTGDFGYYAQQKRGA